jgi:hypothetical protein
MRINDSKEYDLKLIPKLLVVNNKAFLCLAASAMAFLFLALLTVAKTTAIIFTEICSTANNRVAGSFIAAPKSAKAPVVIGLRKKYRTNPINNCVCKEIIKNKPALRSVSVNSAFDDFPRCARMITLSPKINTSTKSTMWTLVTIEYMG